MPRIRGRSNASTITALSEDPFRDLLLPPPNETHAEREERLRAEREAKRISDEIDEELKRERVALKKTNVVRILLLGQSESGKSTTLKNFQIHYAPQAWREERACWKAVIQLNLIRSVMRVLETADAYFSQPSLDDDAVETSQPPLSSRYQSLVSRLATAERILRHRFSPSTATTLEDPGDYRTFFAADPAERSVNKGSLTPSRQEFFVPSSDGAGSWKSRFLNRITHSSAGPDSKLRNSIDNWRTDGKDEVTNIVVECRAEMRRLWDDEDVRTALAQQTGRRVEDTPGFFLGDIDRIASYGYEPCDDDVIRARLRTMGVQEHRFTIERGSDSGREWRVYDIGGARSQRASWLSFFDDIDAIIFLAPISCFDEILDEDRRINRLEDSLILWRSLCRSPLLDQVQLVLFLNKIDILRRKITNGVMVARHVTSFGDRPNDVETVCKYFKQKFKEIQKQYSPTPRPYYVYFTSVTDTKATGNTLRIVREGILRANLRRADFL